LRLPPSHPPFLFQLSFHLRITMKSCVCFSSYHARCQFTVYLYIHLCMIVSTSPQYPTASIHWHHLFLYRHHLFLLAPTGCRPSHRMERDGREDAHIGLELPEQWQVCCPIRRVQARKVELAAAIPSRRFAGEKRARKLDRQTKPQREVSITALLCPPPLLST
jgi:hypothetical protein